MPKKPFVALITPISKPSEPPGEKPPIDLLPHPEHPIYYPLPPDAPVDPDYGVPEPPPEVDGGPVEPPTDGKPPEDKPPRPDHTLPGDLPHVEHPIVLPPDSGGWVPVFIHHPIVLPGDPEWGPPVKPEPPKPGDVVDWKAAWTPTTGWIVIGIPQVPVPTPSKKKRR